MSDLYERAKAASAAAARRIAFGHPSQWPMPSGEAAQDAFERDLSTSDDDREGDDLGGDYDDHPWFEDL